MSSETGNDTSTTCPSPATLRDWLSDRYELSELESQHFNQCDSCQQLALKLSGDDELRAWFDRGPVRSEYSRFALEPEFAKVRSLLAHAPPRPIESESSEGEAGARVSRQFDSTQRIVRIDTEPAVPQGLGSEELTALLPADRFLVQRKISSGGTGVVYLAHDLRMQRDVAIKVLSRNTYRDRTRFMREARLLADLAHENIVTVFEFGALTERAARGDAKNQFEQLYLVMEYVAGGTALDLVKEQTADTAAAQQPTYFEIARLMAGAASGLHYAHLQQLIHRDVKPSNLLLSADRKLLKVADFGLARAMTDDATQVTRTGDVLGTPAFMSPEQVAGEALGVTSDVYSLGATLYQVLTGLVPFQGNTTAIMRQVSDADPVALRLINPQIPRDLETICLRAMSKSPRDRYLTMKLLAEDLIRFSRSEPIQAKPISSVRKAWMLVRKNRSLAISLLASTLLTITLAIGGTVAALIFKNQNSKLQQAVESEGAALLAATNSRRESIDAASELLVAVTEDADLLPKAPGSEEISRKLLNRARNYYAKLVSTKQHDEDLDFDIARAHSGLAQVALALGEHDKVVSETDAALKILNELSKADDLATPRISLLRAKTLNILGKSLATREEFDAARFQLGRSAAYCRVAMYEFPKEPEIFYAYADCMRTQAIAENASGRLNDAEISLKIAINTLEKLSDRFPLDGRNLRMLAGCQTTLALTLVRKSGYETARTLLEQSIETFDKLKVDGVLPVRVRADNATNYINLAMVEEQLGNIDRAEQLFDAASSEYETLAALEPNVAGHKLNIAMTILNSGNVYLERNRIDALREKYLIAQDIVQGLLETDPESPSYLGTLGMIQSNLAIFSQMQGRPAEAIPPLASATVTLERFAELVNHTPDSVLAMALNHYELSKCFFDINDLTTALQSLARSAEFTRTVLKDHPDYIPALCHEVDECILRSDILIEAQPIDREQLLSASLAAVEKCQTLINAHSDLPDYSVKLGVAFSCLAAAHMATGSPAAAEKSADKGILHLETLPDQSNDEIIDALRWNYLVLAQCAAQQLTQATLGELDSESKLTAAQLKLRLAELIDKCQSLGAADDELQTLREALAKSA